jgi:hypothetical protein
MENIIHKNMKIITSMENMSNTLEEMKNYVKEIKEQLEKAVLAYLKEEGFRQNQILCSPSSELPEGQIYDDDESGKTSDGVLEDPYVKTSTLNNKDEKTYLKVENLIEDEKKSLKWKAEEFSNDSEAVRKEENETSTTTIPYYAMSPSPTFSFQLPHFIPQPKLEIP